MTAPLRPTTLEVDLQAAADNLRAVRRLVGPARKICAVIKADAYGFGAAEMGAVFARYGADYLAVADLAEGVQGHLEITPAEVAARHPRLFRR